MLCLYLEKGGLAASFEDSPHLPGREALKQFAPQVLVCAVHVLSLAYIQPVLAELLSDISTSNRARVKRSSRHLAAQRLAELVRRLVRRWSRPHQLRQKEHSSVVEPCVTR